jgi:hypothetical protein
MTTKHRNLSETILGHLKRNPGQQFQCQQLAKQFGCDTKTMRNCLDSLIDAGNIRSLVVYNKREFYWPTDAQQTAMDAPLLPKYVWKDLKLNPVLLAQGEQAAAHREAFPSGPSGAAQEVSELDRNKLAFIGATN